MAANMKALQLVLDLRKREEETALEIYSIAMQQLAFFRDQIEKLKEYRMEYVHELEERGRKEGFRAGTYISFQGFLKKLDDIIARQIQQMHLLELDVDQKHKIYLMRQKRRKIIEKLIEKYEEQRIKAENKAEQKLLDEFAVAQVHRRRMEEA